MILRRKQTPKWGARLPLASQTADGRVASAGGPVGPATDGPAGPPSRLRQETGVLFSDLLFDVLPFSGFLSLTASCCFFKVFQGLLRRPDFQRLGPQMRYYLFYVQHHALLVLKVLKFNTTVLQYLFWVILFPEINCVVPERCST
jgi:hypothetical protein